MEDIYIVSGVRTAVGDFGGSLKSFMPSDLGGKVVTEALARAGVAPEDVGHIVIGQVMPTSAKDEMLSRVIGINAGVPFEVPSLTLNRLCGSGVQAIVSAAQMMKLGEAGITVAGGAESMSNVPYHDHGVRWGKKMGANTQEDALTVGLSDAIGGYHMGITAENVAKKYGITREQQDALAFGSQQKAAAAQDAGRFKDEIVPVTIPQKKGDPVVFEADEFINRRSTADALAGLKPAFDKAGSVTAGNASGLNDGAAGVVVMSAAKAAALGLKPLARIASYASAGLDPAYMGMGPVPAAKKALERAGWKPADLDLLEINEAFAAQACAVHNEMGWDLSKVNVNGGAIALGHPIGASGCRILVTLLHEMIRRDARKGIASLCIGGGMGVALTVER